jgi:hypothetical protein
MPFAAEVYNDETFVVLIAAAVLANYFIVVGGETTESPLSAALGFTCGGLAAASNERGRGGRVKLLASVHD